MIVQILTIGLAALILILVIELIREEKLTFKYAAGWIFVATLAIFLTIFDHVLFNLAHVFGFELRANFILFMILSVLVFLSLLMTVFLCQQNNRNDTIAQKIGILEFENDQLRKKMDDTSMKSQNITNE